MLPIFLFLIVFMIFNNLTTERERERFFTFQKVAKMASIIKHDAHKLGNLYKLYRYHINSVVHFDACTCLILLDVCLRPGGFNFVNDTV